jgi:hypothetical protein
MEIHVDHDMAPNCISPFASRCRVVRSLGWHSDERSPLNRLVHAPTVAANAVAPGGEHSKTKLRNF